MEQERIIVLINGSMNNPSFTKKVLKEVEKRLQKNKAKTMFIDIRDLQLPVYDPKAESPKEIIEVSNILKKADGLVVGVPEYHGSYTGAVKNLLDYLGFEEFQQTPIALLATAGGIKSGTNTLNHLRLVFRNLHGHVIPQQFAISKNETNPELELDPSMDLRLEKFIQGLETEVHKKLLFEKWEKSQSGEVPAEK
ncbi:NAD(P)H-dependent FMN reductase [Evansella vedderi]|uniref:NAD(P)H-dependent FMN reductase n=1 Tax=Evansella vedderi TaxID=38282 RepID=A0ABT9ZXY4_9BACI|nr:NAD(P)H-dependent oxidoreductase [Evansella vedderi]MDQ0256098.1 NAD(P)H-dependent FMN reductase [Evansella vedderi]